jgi:hypothetical protein
MSLHAEIRRIYEKHELLHEELTFYEQWLNKLEFDSTPDDVAICEALIAFNSTESGDIDAYWSTLWDPY